MRKNTLPNLLNLIHDVGAAHVFYASLPQSNIKYSSLSQNLKSIVLVELDDGRALRLGEAVVVELHYIIHRVFDFLADVTEGHSGGLPREVG